MPYLPLVPCGSLLSCFLTFGNRTSAGMSRLLPSVMVIVPCPDPFASRVTTPLTPLAKETSTFSVP